MEELLRKMARQLDGLDEASLMSLWDKYANLVSRFEPTKRWEDAVLILSFIQAKRWKNQLFNSNWQASLNPDTKPADSPRKEPPDAVRSPCTAQQNTADENTPVPDKKNPRRASILVFHPKVSPVVDDLPR